MNFDAKNYRIVGEKIIFVDAIGSGLVVAIDKIGFVNEGNGVADIGIPGASVRLKGENATEFYNWYAFDQVSDGFEI